MKTSTWLALSAGALGAVMALVWAFSPRPVEVEVALVTQGHFESSIDEDGKTRLRDRYVVSAPLMGSVSRLVWREGDEVQAGQVVATLRPMLPTLLDDRSVREQKIRVETTQANVLRAQARIEGAKVLLHQAQNEQLRSEQLAPQGFVSPMKLEADRLAVMAAQKELEAAQQDRHVAGHEVDQARAALMAIQAPSAQAGRTLELKSPITGRVLRLLQTSESTVSLGAPLLEVGDTARMEVVAELLTSDAIQAKPNSRVLIDRWGGKGLLEGRVRVIEPSAFTKISALGVEEQRVKVVMDITSPVDQWRALGDGFRVGVRVITTSVDNAVCVPVSAVFPDELKKSGMAAFTLDGNRVKRVSLEVKARNATQAWVTQGLKPGMAVIVYPSSAVKDGVSAHRRQV